uniref:Uncharacterized protein n=1 Tax=Ixodes ricinus TaxID=34613 RepID=A0A6B0U5H1_IXORI
MMATAVISPLLFPLPPPHSRPFPLLLFPRVALPVCYVSCLVGTFLAATTRFCAPPPPLSTSSLESCQSSWLLIYFVLHLKTASRVFCVQTSPCSLAAA